MQGECEETYPYNIKWLEAIYHKSECYYQKGYFLVTQRRLSQAVPYLKKAIALHKYHLDAYNLLGLVYFEMGETGQALKTWILSTSLQKDHNRANVYLEEVQSQKRTLEKYKQAMKLYNEAIHYFRQRNEDMAIIRLKKCVQGHPQFVEARNLLTLAYIARHKNVKAMEQIRAVLTIDMENPKALMYLKEIQLGQDVAKYSDDEAVLTYRTKRDCGKAQRVINRGHVLGTAVVYFICGLACMFAVQIGLILPSKTEALELQVQQVQSKADSDLEKIRSSLDQATTEILRLKDENKKITAQKEELQNTNSRLAQQTRIGMVSELKNTKQWIEAAQVLYSIAQEQLADPYRKQYDTLKNEVYPKAGEAIYSDGLSRYQKGDYIESFAQFEKVQLYVPKTTTAANSLYYMGMIEEKNNQPEKAVQYYETVCAEYEGISAYYKAKERLKRLAK
ncbi:MAG: hypothetical protein ACRCW2_12880 [Cellulosilyticaceae bacterium]